MDSKRVTDELVKLHQDIQMHGGYDPAAVKATCTPLRDLPGFDSLLVPVVYRRLARVLGVPLPADFRVPNIYVDTSGRQRRTIAEIAGAFCDGLRAQAA